MGGLFLKPEMITVVVPAYNEAEGLAAFHARLAAVMAAFARWEVIYVNDGSNDATLRVIEPLRAEDGHVGFVNLQRNFGKEIATTAGLDHARGDAVVVIDADLQDPPELIPDSGGCLACRRGHGLRSTPGARR